MDDLHIQLGQLLQVQLRQAETIMFQKGQKGA